MPLPGPKRDKPKPNRMAIDDLLLGPTAEQPPNLEDFSVPSSTEEDEYPDGCGAHDDDKDPYNGVEPTTSPFSSGPLVRPSDAIPDVIAIPLPTVEGEGEEEKWYKYKMAWTGKIYDIEVGANDLVYDFRKTIDGLTNVPPERQKVIGLLKGAGKLSSELDGTRFGNLWLKDGVVKFTLIGTPEDQSFKDNRRKDTPTDDFDVLYQSANGENRKIKGTKSKQLPALEDPRNKRKIKQAIEAHPITVMNPPRPGKKLLVLDLDYTLVDTKPLLNGSLPTVECARPGMHEFLESAYRDYDIVIWSQTHWRWLETKLVELGILGGAVNYKICFVLDRLPMFPIFAMKSDGSLYKHEVKPLDYIYHTFPQWSPDNSIHIDDLSRNFAMNPGQGLKIKAYKHAQDQPDDHELDELALYLRWLALWNGTWRDINHNHWRTVLDRQRQLEPRPN